MGRGVGGDRDGTLGGGFRRTQAGGQCVTGRHPRTRSGGLGVLVTRPAWHRARSVRIFARAPETGASAEEGTVGRHASAGAVNTPVASCYSGADGEEAPVNQGGRARTGPGLGARGWEEGREGALGRRVARAAPGVRAQGGAVAVGEAEERLGRRDRSSAARHDRTNP
jgi:hypothetical protein